MLCLTVLANVVERFVTSKLKTIIFRPPAQVSKSVNYSITVSCDIMDS